MKGRLVQFTIINESETKFNNLTRLRGTVDNNAPAEAGIFLTNAETINPSSMEKIKIEDIFVPWGLIRGTVCVLPQ